MRCVQVRLLKSKPKKEALLEHLRSAFDVSEELLARISDDEAGYTRAHAVAFLRWQLNALEDHPTYTRESFELCGNTAYARYLEGERTRIKELIARHGKEKEMSGLEDEFEGAMTDGHPLFQQLLVSLLSYDRNVALLNADKESIVADMLASTKALLLEDAASAALDLDVIFADNTAALTTLVALSPLSETLLSEYQARYAVRPLYRQLCMFAYVTPHLRHTMRHMCLTHLMLHRLFVTLRRADTIYNATEFELLKVTYKRLWADVYKNFLSNVLRYFSGANLPNLVMMIKLMLLLAEVRQWTKAREGKSFQFDYKATMRTLIVVRHLSVSFSFDTYLLKFVRTHSATTTRRCSTRSSPSGPHHPSIPRPLRR